jgi:L-alanine-DL-glutamate epimerase-like enolase superfamily enzyme
MLIDWTFETLTLPLKYTWAISRNSSDVKLNALIQLNVNGKWYKGEAAPNVRYNESIETHLQQFTLFKNNFTFDLIHDPDGFNLYLDSLHLSKSLRFAIESAFVHYHMDNDTQFFERYTGLTPNFSPTSTAYTLPLMDPSQLQSFITHHQLNRFKALKIKTNQDLQEDLVKWTCKYFEGPIYIDANEAWQDPDAFIRSVEKMKHYPIKFIEQPFPSVENERYRYLKKHAIFPIFADESIIDDKNLKEIKELFHGVNMKLMKAGGYREGASILLKSRELGLKTLIGCMVETSLGIRSGMYFSCHFDYVDLDGSFVIDNEPFKLVSENLGWLEIRTS